MTMTQSGWMEVLDNGFSVRVEQPRIALGVDDGATMLGSRPCGPRRWKLRWPDGFEFETVGEQPLHTLLTGICIP